LLALIFGLEALSLLFVLLVLLVLQERKSAAVGLYGLSLLMTLFWFDHHATDFLGISL
jgi:hypothetical protein